MAVLEMGTRWFSLMTAGVYILTMQKEVNKCSVDLIYSFSFLIHDIYVYRTA